jgi:hypothetical protein
MYCPKCAGQNAEDSKFCRVCGTDLSLIADAMTGRLRRSGKTKKVRRDRDSANPQSLQKAIASGFMGLGFIVVALTLMLTGEEWGVYMFIPGFLMLGKGVSTFMALRLAQPATNDLSTSNVDRQTPRTGELTPPPGYVNAPASQPTYRDLPAAPPSVTEGTTRIMDSPVQRSRESQ